MISGKHNEGCKEDNTDHFGEKKMFWWWWPQDVSASFSWSTLPNGKAKERLKFSEARRRLWTWPRTRQVEGGWRMVTDLPGQSGRCDKRTVCSGKPGGVQGLEGPGSSEKLEWAERLKTGMDWSSVTGAAGWPGPCSFIGSMSYFLISSRSRSLSSRMMRTKGIELRGTRHNRGPGRGARQQTGGWGKVCILIKVRPSFFCLQTASSTEPRSSFAGNSSKHLSWRKWIARCVWITELPYVMPSRWQGRLSCAEIIIQLWVPPPLTRNRLPRITRYWRKPSSVKGSDQKQKTGE